MKQRIMVFCDFYPPSYKSGGGMWTVVNFVDRFSDQFDFFIVTRNHNSVSDTAPFETVLSNEWNDAENARVYYASPSAMTVGRFRRLVAEIKPDAFFLNSTFSRPAATFLLSRLNNSYRKIPVILAPCGEFSEGALSLKPLKKAAFLRGAKHTKLYRDIIWKASFTAEAEEIRKLMGNDAEVWNAPDIAPRSILPDYQQSQKGIKTPGSVRFVFFSRFTRKKNILYFIELLESVDVGEIELEIVGPLEDSEYWNECKQIIDRYPPNVTARLAGAFALQEDDLRQVMRSHFFVLPTLNENFGYVFIEAMATGCPVLTSDRTVWEDIERKNVGWRIPLEDRNQWLRTINECIQMDKDRYSEMSVAARRYVTEWLKVDETVEANLKVLERALGRSPATVSNGAQ